MFARSDRADCNLVIFGTDNGRVTKVMTESWRASSNETPVGLKEEENTDGYNFHLRRSHGIPAMHRLMTDFLWETQHN